MQATVLMLNSIMVSVCQLLALFVIWQCVALFPSNKHTAQTVSDY